MPYAVNIADLTRYDPITTGCLVAPVIQGRQIVRTDPKVFDGAGVLLECKDEQATAVIEVLRLQDTKAKRYACRAWKQGPKGGWNKV